jgi:hypothetical protein
MSTSKALNGFRPSRIRGSGANSTGQSEYPIASAYDTNIFTGDLVRVVDGNIQRIVSTTDMITGVFLGCSYVADGEPKFSKYWPANTSATKAVAYVADDPSATFIVQADASVTAGDINSQNFDVTLGSGSTVTGNSGFGIKASTRTTGLAPVRPISVWAVPGNDIAVGAERAYPVLEVRITQNPDQFITVVASTGALVAPTSTTY